MSAYLRSQLVTIYLSGYPNIPYGGGMLPLSPGLRLEPMHFRERPTAELSAVFAGGWPPFVEADELAAEYLPAVRATCPELEIALLEQGVLVAAG